MLICKVERSRMERKTRKDKEVDDTEPMVEIQSKVQGESHFDADRRRHVRRI